MNAEFGFNAEYLKECAKRRKKPEERVYPKKDWPVGYEPTEKEFEEWMEEGTGVPVSFHWEEIGGGKKRGVFTPLPIKKNLDKFEEVFGKDQPVSFKIKGLDGELRKVSKEEFASWMMEEKEEKIIETPPQESLVVSASGDINEITVFVERKGQNGVFRESYYRLRSEAEKNQIIERNRKIRELEKKEKVNLEPKTQNLEKSPTENLENKEAGEIHSAQKSEVQQKNESSKRDSDWKDKSLVWGGAGIVGLLGIVIGVVKWKRS